MRTNTVAKWLLQNIRDVKSLAGNPYAQQLLVAAGEWRKSYDKQGATLTRLEDCIRQWAAFIETPKGRTALAVARDRNGSEGHRTPARQGQAINVSRPAQRVARTNKNGRAVR